MCRNRTARKENSRDQSGQSLPGAYKCSPTKTQTTKVAPTKKSHHCNAGNDKLDHMEWVECHYGGVAIGGGDGGDGCHSATPSRYDEQPHFGSDEGHQQNCENTSATNANLQLEIAPGVFALVRGSDETWNAIERGFSSNVECFVCSTSLICIADADYVLCPDCRVVSPTGAEEKKMPASSSVFYQYHRGGVGLGLKGRHDDSTGSMSQY
jgi:hypothetical protein